MSTVDILANTQTPVHARLLINGEWVEGDARMEVRNPAHPDLPTVRETGVAQLELESWFGLFAPSKTSPEVLQRLRSELAGVVVAPDVTETFVKAGGRPLSLDETATRKLVEGDVSRWTTLIREAGITSE